MSLLICLCTARGKNYKNLHHISITYSKAYGKGFSNQVINPQSAITRAPHSSVFLFSFFQLIILLTSSLLCFILRVFIASFVHFELPKREKKKRKHSKNYRAEMLAQADNRHKAVQQCISIQSYRCKKCPWVAKSTIHRRFNEPSNPMF